MYICIYNYLYIQLYVYLNSWICRNKDNLIGRYTNIYIIKYMYSHITV